MDILEITIRGKLAHFRKYYANNTAFSFSIPPRTTLMGMVAAMMGWQRDTYYKKLASENIRFAVRVLSPVKKSFQRLNFLSVKSLGDFSKGWNSDFRGQGGRIQTPFEIVSGLNIAKDEVGYQLFIAATEKGKSIFEDIKSHCLHKPPVYNLSFGTANFQAAIDQIHLIPDDKVSSQSLDDFVLLHSAVPSEQVEALEFEKGEQDQYNFVEEDLFPAEFVANAKREVKTMNRLLFSTTEKPLRVKLNAPFYQLETGGQVLNIQFLET